MSLMQDEVGNVSSARWLLWITAMFTLVMIALDSVYKSVDVPPAAYTLLGSAILAFAGWAAGPRIMDHIAKMAPGIASSIAASKLPNVFKDDER